ncbi:MAG: carbon storage regulator CsrA [Caldicoprobacterales bacterium]|jgi:carbon storage regulator
MLVLTRRKDESIMIGNGIEIVVLGIDGDRVRIGIEAPKDITILRKEVYLDVADTNRQALSSALPKDLPLSDIFPQED